MRKLIDLKDETLQDLKILAVKNDKSLKSHIEAIIDSHIEISKNTQLSDYIKEDGQFLRGLWNYLHLTYENIKDHKNEHEEQFESYRDFLLFISESCQFQIKLIDEDND